MTSVIKNKPKHSANQTSLTSLKPSTEMCEEIAEYIRAYKMNAASEECDWQTKEKICFTSYHRKVEEKMEYWHIKCTMLITKL